MEVRQAVALRGRGGRALISAACRLWSGFRTICQACPGPRRGVARKWSERHVLKSGMPATVSSCPEHEKEPVGRQIVIWRTNRDRAHWADAPSAGPAPPDLTAV